MRNHRARKDMATLIHGHWDSVWSVWVYFGFFHQWNYVTWLEHLYLVASTAWAAWWHNLFKVRKRQGLGLEWVIWGKVPETHTGWTECRWPDMTLATPRVNWEATWIGQARWEAHSDIAGNTDSGSYIEVWFKKVEKSRPSWEFRIQTGPKNVNREIDVFIRWLRGVSEPWERDTAQWHHCTQVTVGPGTVCFQSQSLVVFEVLSSRGLE